MLQSVECQARCLSEVGKLLVGSQARRPSKVDFAPYSELVCQLGGCGHQPASRLAESVTLLWGAGEDMSIATQCSFNLTFDGLKGKFKEQRFHVRIYLS